MKNGKEILLYILIAVATIFIIFAIVERGRDKKEIRDSIEKLESAKTRIDNITEQFKQAGTIINNLREANKQTEIAYSKLEENYRQLEITNKEQERIYREFRKTNKIDAAAIKRLERGIESSEDIIRGILKEIDN